MGHIAGELKSLTLNDGRSLWVRHWHDEREGALVFLHGLLDSSAGWTRVCEHLCGTRVAIDLAGFGYSDPPTEGSIAGYARDVAEALEEIGLRRCTIVGHSLGGAVAAALTELCPDRVAGLVLLAPAGFGRIQLAEAVSVPGLRNVVQAALPFALMSRAAVTAGYMTMVSNGRPPEGDVVERITSRGRWLVHGAREGTRAVVDAGRSSHAFHRRRLAYSGPVFAVWGEQDRLVPPAHRSGVQRALPQAEIEVWPGMGHHPVCERFDELLSLLVRAAAAGDALAGDGAGRHVAAA